MRRERAKEEETVSHGRNDLGSSSVDGRHEQNSVGGEVLVSSEFCGTLGFVFLTVASRRHGFAVGSGSRVLALSIAAGSQVLAISIAAGS